MGNHRSDWRSDRLTDRVETECFRRVRWWELLARLGTSSSSGSFPSETLREEEVTRFGEKKTFI